MINTHPTRCNICGGRVIYGSNARVYGREYGSSYCYLLFDPLWQGKPKAHKKRNDLYNWLASEMKIPVEDCHFGYFNLDQLRRAYIILRGVKDKQMRYDDCGKIHFEEATHEVSEP